MAGDVGGHRIPVGWTVAAVVAVLAFVNMIDVRIAHASLVVGPVGAAGLLTLARRAGLSWHELGLGTGTWRRGLVWAAAAFGAVTVVFAAGAALPLTRAAFRDSRYDLGWPDALLTAFVLIPLGTVLVEEVAFRGVLWGLLRRARGAWTATIVSSALFGLWHVLPSLGLATDNEAIRSTGRNRHVRQGPLCAGNGAVYCPVRGGVLRAAAPQRQPARLGRPALGDKRRGGTRGCGGVGGEFPVAVALLAVARVLWRAVRWVARLLGRFLPPAAATAAALLVVCVVLGLFVSGVLVRFVSSRTDAIFAGVDNTTAAGVAEPAAPQRSGSPASDVPWPTVGRQGRTFVAGGPTTAQISAFTGEPAEEPIRVYVGLKSAPSIPAEAALAVREMDRTGAFDRKVLVVATTTGTGWVNKDMVDPVEYMYDGDTAVAAIQPGVSPSLHWYPLVTFWQVTADMADSTSVPPGAGHVYSTLKGASAWASIIPPPGWTPERTAALARPLAD